MSKAGGAVKLIKTRIRLPAWLSFMGVTINATQREQRHGLAWNYCVNRNVPLTKLPPNEFTTLILKGRGSRRGPMIWGPFWALQFDVWGSGQVTPDLGTQRISHAAGRAIYCWSTSNKTLLQWTHHPKPQPTARGPCTVLKGELALQHCCSNPDRRYSGSCEAAVLGRAIFDGIMSETVALYLWDF